MDEATSSLDPETDHILQNAVSQYYKDCTVISIAVSVIFANFFFFANTVFFILMYSLRWNNAV